jgi:cytochrome c oxidase subunit 2
MMRPALVLCAVIALSMIACQEPPATEPVARGRQVYRQQGCAQCHQIEGSGGRLGPDLSHIATVAATRRPGAAAEDYVRESIEQPGAYIVPGFNDIMPRALGQGLSEFDRESLIRYLMTLDQ